MSTADSPPGGILLLGAGTLGLPILLALATHASRSNTAITLAARNPDTSELSALFQAHAIQPLALDIVSSTSAALSLLFARYDTVISCTGMTFPPGTQRKIASAALTSGVRRFFPWQFGVDYDVIGAAGGGKQDLFAEQLEVRALLRAQAKVQWVVVSCGVFADFLVGTKAGFGVVEWHEETEIAVRALGGWSNRVTATKVEDIAKVVAQLVFVDQDVDGIVHIAGQTVSYEDVARAVEKAIGKQNVRREVWNISHLAADLDMDPENGMKKYRVAFAEGTGVAWDQETTWSHKKKLTMSTVDDWVKEYLLK